MNMDNMGANIQQQASGILTVNMEVSILISVLLILMQ